MWRFSPVSSAWEEVDESSIHQLRTPEHDRSKPDHGTCGCLDAFRCSCVSAASLNFLPSGLTINCKPNNILPYYISCKKRNSKISKSWKAPISASQLCFDFLAWRHLGRHLRRRSVGDTVIWKFETTSSSWWSFPLVVLIRRRGTNFDAPTSSFHTNTPSPDPIRMTCTFIGIEPGQPADHSASIVLTRLSWWSCKSHSKLPLNENRSFIRSGQNVKVMCFMDLLQLPHSCSVLGFKFQSEVLQFCIPPVGMAHHLCSQLALVKIRTLDPAFETKRLKPFEGIPQLRRIPNEFSYFVTSWILSEVPSSNMFRSSKSKSRSTIRSIVKELKENEYDTVWNLISFNDAIGYEKRSYLPACNWPTTSEGFNPWSYCCRVALDSS